MGIAGFIFFVAQVSDSLACSAWCPSADGFQCFVSKARLFGGGDADDQCVTPQSKRSRLHDPDDPERSDWVVAPSLPSPGSGHSGAGSGRKPQRTLASFWGSPGPQLSVHRSPEHLLKVAQYKAEESQRKQLAETRQAKLPGQWLVPVDKKPHSGGASGGRTAVGPQRGRAVGRSSNKRYLGESVLRRDPSLPFKLAVIHQAEALASNSGAVATHSRREIERSSGFSWKTVIQWCRRKEEFAKEFSRLRLGKWGLRPFGSTLASSRKQSSSLGCRIRKKPRQDYQSAVILQLKVWFERERQYGHEVRTSLIFEFYLKFLEKQCALCKAQLAHVGQLAGRLKDKAVAWGSGKLSPDDQQAALSEASRLSVSHKQLTSDRKQLEDRITMLTSSSRPKVDKFFSKVLVKIGAHLRKPSRKTRLTSDQEAVRIALTWQSYDRAQYVAVQGTDEELLEQVHSPAQWRENVKKTVIASWDHAPVWLMVSGDSKVAFSQNEVSREGSRRRLSKKSKDAACEFYAALVQPDSEDGVYEARSRLLQLAAEAKQAEESHGKSAPVQSRGVYSPGGDKYRVTAVVFQSVVDWFDPSKTPSVGI